MGRTRPRTHTHTHTRAADATSRLHTTRTARIGVAMSATALITGGAAVVVILDGHRYIGISFLIAGISALAILIPATHRFIDRRRPSVSREPVTADATNKPTSPAT